VKKISRRTSGSPRRSHAQGPTKPRAHSTPPRSGPQRGIARASVDAVVAFAELAEREHLRWYLFGAQAVAAYGVPRTTGDVDITLDRGHLNDGLPVLPNFTGFGYLAGSMPSLRLPVEALPRLPLPSFSAP
jgi:hypothetical protein